MRLAPGGEERDLRSKTQWAAVRTCRRDIRAPEQASPGVPEGAVLGAPPTSIPTAEKGKRSVSATRVRLSDEKGDDEEEEGLTVVRDAALIAALAISTASSEMEMVRWRRPRRGVAGAATSPGVLRKASPERVTRRVLEEEEEVVPGRGGGKSSCGDDDDDGATLLLPPSFEKVTLPINSYAEQEQTIILKKKASTEGEDARPRLERGAEG